MMRGKGGFIRILEAFIAIIIIAGAMAFIYVNQVQRPNQEEAINELIRLTLEKISNDPTLRGAVLNGHFFYGSGASRNLVENEIEKFIREDNDLEFSFKICELNEICDLEERVSKEVFSQEITVSSTLDLYSPKVLRIFVWEK